MSIPQASLRVQAERELAVGSSRTGAPFAPCIPSSSSMSAAMSADTFPSLVTPWGSVSSSVVQVAGIWLFQETAQRLQQAACGVPLPGRWPVAPTTRARKAVANDLQPPLPGSPAQFTQHAFLVAYGEFAHEIGLIQRLRQVTIPQKDVIHLSQAKVLTFFLGILTGIAHLRDLNDGPHPLAHDGPALRAWGLAAIAHYTGVSRTAARCDEKAIAAVTQVLGDVSQPFIDREVALLLARKLPLILDLDLAPRPVSNTSTTFPDAQFGWQDDQVGQGYDAALVSLTCLTYGRLLLTGFHYPRNPIALPRLQAMITAAEARLGRRPRRRPELVKQRLQALAEPLAQRLDWLQAQLNRQKECLAQLDTLPAEVARLETEVTTLEADYQSRGREAKPHSQLAQARHRLTAMRQKLADLPEQLRRAEQTAAAHRQRLDQLQAEYTALKAHQAQLEADNAANPEPVVMVARLDAGFGTGPNVTWLIEMATWCTPKPTTPKWRPGSKTRCRWMPAGPAWAPMPRCWPGAKARSANAPTR
jgi:outer membrane murein-binding lipoprotein Lpp